MRILAPSLLAADFSQLANEIQLINESEAQWLHIDVMDGVFVPNISFGTPIIEAVKPICTKFFDVHLMITQPERYIDLFHELGADLLTIHYEASTHLHRSLQNIKAKGMKTGVALNPHTSITLLDDCLDLIDVVLIMSVNPGFGGQTFIENTYHKVEKLKERIERRNTSTLIEIDGGVNKDNAARLYNCGADILVAGNAVFKATNPKQMIHEILHAQNP